VVLSLALAQPAEASEKLKVGVAGSSPFVVQGENGMTGASVEIWRAVATELDVEYTLVPLPTVDALIDATATGSIAVGIGPISITANRAARVDFTQPYYEAHLALLGKPTTSVWKRVRPFLSRAFGVAVGTLLLLLFVIGNLVWFAERRRNAAQFPTKYGSGVGEGMWFAIVTMTTTGYGDRFPITTAGRVVASVWMIFSTIAASSITAGIATALTVSSLDERDASINDLSGKRIAVVRGTAAARIAKRNRARISEWSTREDAIAAVERQQAEAILFDSPALQVWLDAHPSSDLELSILPLASQDYGFALPPGSELRRKIDRAVLSLWERERIQTEIDAWLPRK